MSSPLPPPSAGPPAAPDAVAAAPAPAGLPVPRLWRSRTDRVVAGVLGGLAEKFRLEPRPVRLLYGLLTLVSGGTLLLPYLGLWYMAPARGPGRPTLPPWRSRTRRVVAGVLGGMAERWGVGPAVVRVPFVVASAATGVLPGVVTYLVLWAVRPEGDAPADR